MFKNDIDEAQERDGSRRERKEFRQCVANSMWHLLDGWLLSYAEHDKCATLILQVIAQEQKTSFESDWADSYPGRGRYRECLADALAMSGCGLSLYESVRFAVAWEAANAQEINVLKAFLEENRFHCYVK